MGKNKGKGGKNFKKYKTNYDDQKRQLEFKTEGQEYAIVSKILGNCRCECQCNDGRTRICHIRGSMAKRIWICLGDTILVSLRDFQDDKGDIIHKYTHDEALKLRSYNEINHDPSVFRTEDNLIKTNNDDDDDDDCIDFEDI